MIIIKIITKMIFMFIFLLVYQKLINHNHNLLYILKIVVEGHNIILNHLFFKCLHPKELEQVKFYLPVHPL